MSDKIFRLELVPRGMKNTKDTATNIKRKANTFNKYTNAGSGDLCNDQCTAIYGLHRAHKSIVYVDPMAVVWHHFEEWTQSNIGQDKTAILVAYNRENFNIIWLWKLTQTP